MTVPGSFPNSDRDGGGPVESAAPPPSAVLRPAENRLVTESADARSNRPGRSPAAGGRKRYRRRVAAAAAIALAAVVAGYAAGLANSADSTGASPGPGLRLLEPGSDGDGLSAARSETASGGAGGLPGGEEGEEEEASLQPSGIATDAPSGAGEPQRDPNASDRTGSADPSDPPGPIAPSAGEVDPVVAVAEILAPSVVRIEVGSGFSQGVGSGIAWDAENGYIVTNHHVVEGVEQVTVWLADGTRVDGEVVGGSPAHDVAVVRVDPSEAKLVAATFAGGSSVRIGQLAVAIGSPFGLTGTVTAGIVSAVRIQVVTRMDPDNPVPMEMIQTDAAINSGNSGGALADSQGRVIGMNTYIQTTSGGNIGLGFAVPSDTVELIAARVINGESLELGYVGISSTAGDTDVQGVLVAEVVEGSPAAEAGLEAGDVILSLDGRPIQDMAELSAAVKLRMPGEAVELTMRRGEDTYVATVVLGTWE